VKWDRIDRPTDRSGFWSYGGKFLDLAFEEFHEMCELLPPSMMDSNAE